jgi:hypothetical protein
MDLMPDVTFFCHEKLSTILATLDPMIVLEAKQYRKSLEASWQEVEACMLNAPDIFDRETINERLFLSLYA